MIRMTDHQLVRDQNSIALQTAVVAGATSGAKLGCDGLLGLAGGFGASSILLYLMTATFAFFFLYHPPSAVPRHILLSGTMLVCLLAVIGLLPMTGRGVGWLYGACCGLAAAITLSLVFSDTSSSLNLFTQQLATDAFAGADVVLIPLGVGGLLWFRGQSGRKSAERAPMVIGLSVLLAVGAIGLFAVRERSAVAALSAGAIYGLYAWWRPTTRQGRWRRAVVDLLLVGLPCILLCLYIGAFIFGSRVLLAPAPGSLFLQPLFERFEAWLPLLPVLVDYRFTGSGIGASGMVLSSYFHQLHVPYLSHLYNLYLQIVMEQGFIGLLGFLMLIGATLSVLALVARFGAQRHRVLVASSTAALVGMLLHGLVDSSLYVSSLAWVMLLPMVGVWVLFYRTFRNPSRWMVSPCRSPMFTGLFAEAWLARISGLLIPTAVAALFFLLPGTASAIHTNWGAVQQTRAELSAYSSADWSIQDELRLSPLVDLGPATDHYRAALAYDRTNSAAHRRLGQIALSQGQYGEALAHLQVAHSRAPGDQAAQRLLGEAYAVTGEPALALSVWQGITYTQNQMADRLWWYGHDSETDRAVWLDRAFSDFCQTSGNCP